MTVLLRETNDVAGDDDAPAPRLLETLPAAWADAVAIQSPAMAAVEGAAEATWAARASPTKGAIEAVGEILREDDIVALLDDEEEEAWDPRERFIFSL